MGVKVRLRRRRSSVSCGWRWLRVRGRRAGRGWDPRAQPWASAVPSGPVSVTHQRVARVGGRGGDEARVSPASSRPQPPAWAGAADQPSSVPAGTHEVDQGGDGAGPPGRPVDCRPGPVVLRRAGPGARPGRVAGGGSRRGRGLDPVQRVASLGQVGQRQGPQPVQAAFEQPALAQPGGDRVEVGLGRQHVGGVQFPPGQARVAGGLAAGLDPLPVPLGVLPAGLDRLGVELHLQRGGLAGQLLGPQVRGRPGEDLVRHGGVGGGEAAGVERDPPGPPGVDQPGGHPGQGRAAAGWSGRWRRRSGARPPPG